MYFFYYLPIGINARVRRFPVMTVAYTALCIAVFAAVRYLPGTVSLNFYNMIYVPQSGGVLVAIAAGFLHFGYMHLIGNLIYLTFFGRYVEDRMGPTLFTLLFLSSAWIGNYLQGIFNTHVLHDPEIGIVGASGAISGLLGAFTVRFLRSKLQIAYWVFFPLQAFTRAGRVEMPAVFAVGFWFLMQIARGLVQVGGAAAQVAYVTHISGFLWGVALALLFGQHREGAIEALVRKGHEYMRRNQPYAAQGAYIRYLTRQPGDATVYAALARAMLLSGNLEGAARNYRKSCEMLLEQGARGEAEAVYQEAVRGDPDFTLQPAIHLDLAFGLERNLKADLAISAYEGFEKRYPMHDDAPFALLRAGGLYWHALENPGGASACYRKLVDKYPTDQWVDFAREQLRRLDFQLPSLG